VAENTQVKQFFNDALSGKLNRREVFQRGIALGVSANVIGMLALNAGKLSNLRTALAAEEGSPSGTFYQWMLNLHPSFRRVGEAMGINIEEAPTENFGFDRFVTEANDQTSTWDFYGGVTPFLEMIALSQSGTIEPWTPHLPEGLFEDFAEPTRVEGTYNGEFYVWPLLLDINVMMWNKKIVEAAGLDPNVAPATWDDQIAAAQTIVDSGAAPYGITFDPRDWRSIIPITHSISTDVYDPETGLFQYASDAAVEALEIMKRMMPLANPDVLNPTSVDNTVAPDEQAFAAEQVGYYFKYQNAGFQFSANWPDPSQINLGPLPKTADGVGGTVFWDTGAVLFTYGANKAKAVEYLQAIGTDEQMWQESITGNPDEGTIPVGQLPILNSVWTAWEASPPEFLAANPWARSVFDSLPNASAIAPTPLGVLQFDTARAEWIKYLSGEESDARTALQKAQDAARAVYDENVTA
jgi:ABC-type glycerol-3-phosphate transport system substrate-binding protein